MPRLRLALLLTVGSLACGSPGAVSSDLLARNQVVAYSLLAAREAGDREAMAALFRTDAVFDDFSASVQYRGVVEIASFLVEPHAWGSDVVLTPTAVHPSPTGAVVEWVFSAVQTGTILNRVEVGTGREVVLNGVTILEISDGLVTRGADYVDALPLILQVGGRVEMPGGTVLALPEGR